MHSAHVTREVVIERLRAVEGEVRRLDVRRLARFGSFVRGEARPDKDVDVLVEFEADRKTCDAFLCLAELSEEALNRRVDLVTTEALSPFIGPHILAEAVDVVRAA